jgi:hypothetical protein
VRITGGCGDRGHSSSGSDVGALRPIGGGGIWDATGGDAMGAAGGGATWGLCFTTLGDRRGIQGSSLRAHDSNTGLGGGVNINGGPDTGRGMGVPAIDAKGTSTFGGGAGGLTGLGAEGGSLGLLVLVCPRDGGGGLHSRTNLW